MFYICMLILIGTSKHSLLSRNGDILQKDSKLQTTREQYNTALSQKLFEIESNRLEVRRSNKMLKKILQNWGKSKAKREVAIYFLFFNLTYFLGKLAV